MILAAINDRVWIALMLLIAAFAAGVIVGRSVPCWCLA